MESVDVEPRVRVVKALSNDNFAFEQGKALNFAQVQFQSVDVRSIFGIPKTEKTDRVLIENGIFSRQVDNSANNSDTVLDWETKLVEVFNFELLLKKLLGDFKHALEMNGPHLGGQVEEVVGLDLAALDRCDFDFALAVVEAWDLVNCCIESLSVLTLRLPVHVCLLDLVHLLSFLHSLLVLALGQSLALRLLNHFEYLGWVLLQLGCLAADHLLPCLSWLPCLLIISGRVLFLDEIVVELLQKEVSVVALMCVLCGHVRILKVFFSQAEVS